MLRRKLLTILFICILLPLLVILFQSATTFFSQKKSTMDIASRYVSNLAMYAADRWDEGNAERIAAFLSLVADQGYDMLVSIEDVDASKMGNKNNRHKISMKGKFIPGLIAYIKRDGNLISYSQNAAILVNIFNKAVLENALTGRDEGIVGSLRLGSRYITYVAHITPTGTPDVYAIAAVTMLSWMGRNDFNMLRLGFAGILGMLICLVALFLLRGSLILPLQSLSSQVNTLKWGSETPPEETASGLGKLGKKFGGMQVEEISSLKKAIFDLANRMIDKEQLEKRYLGDIIKAQEDERGRIAQDIHDGPIQVVSALIQRIQMANIAAEELPQDTKNQLATAERVAEDLVEDLRDICDSLVPPWVSLGIVSCMEESASRFERQYAITVNMQVDQSLDLPQEITLALFRILQETVSNAVRHGRATKVNVDVVSPEDGRAVMFRIRDNGSGFEQSEEMMKNLVRAGKRGINGIRQRVELLGGTYEILSRPGQGTSITIWI